MIEDGTARIGDLEFRLVELEGGDVSKLSETTTLGGNADVTEPEILVAKPVELAVGEEADFDTAQRALEEKRYEDAAEMFNRFGKTYPTSPLAAQAFLLRGKALEANEDIKGSARAYLESFTNYQNSTVAPEALTLLGKALVKLGRSKQDVKRCRRWKFVSSNDICERLSGLCSLWNVFRACPGPVKTI